MKTLSLVLLLAFASTAYGQIEKQYVWYGTVGTSWVYLAKDTSKPYVKTHQIEIVSDDADGDTLWVAFGTDTTVSASNGNVWPMLQGETMYFASTNIAGIRLKSSTSVPYRVRIY